MRALIDENPPKKKKLKISYVLQLNASISTTGKINK